MMKPQDLPPKAIYRREHTGAFDRVAGWYAMNSVNVDDCYPVWQIAGGGVGKDQLTDYPEALRQCLVYVEHRIVAARRMEARLKASLELVQPHPHVGAQRSE